MGSAMRISGGIVTATVMTAGMTVAQPAYARQTVSVPCSATALATAVNAANAAGEGTLLLASNCDYALTAPSGTGRGPDGLLISGKLRLIGGFATRISRAATAATNFRVIEVAAGASLFLENTAISGGLTDATIAGNDTGGGILNSRGIAYLFHTTIENNTADNGAGISNDSGRLVVLNTHVHDNSTRVGGGGGGGIYNDGSNTIENSIIRSNTANTNGGGVYNGEGGRTEAIQSTIDRNTAGADGGGVFNATDGRLILRRTLIERNTAASGGGVSNAGVPSRVTLFTSVIRANTPNNCAPPGSVAGCVG
jgi:hypothetical protein